MKLGAIIRRDLNKFVFVILAFSLMVAVSYWFARSIVEQLIFVNAGETLSTAEAVIRSDLCKAEAVLLHAGMMIEKMYTGQTSAGEDSLDEIQSYLTLVSGSLNSAEGLPVENSSSDGIQHLVPGLLNIYAYIQNRLWGELPHAASSGFIPKNSPWYLAAEAAGGGIGLSSPYIEADTGKTIISLAKSLRGKDEEIIGIIALDIDFSFLSDYIESLHFDQHFGSESPRGNYGMVFDKNFILLAHPAPDYVNRPMLEVNPAFAGIISKIHEEPNRVYSHKIINYLGIPSILVYKRIYTGWYLGISCPVTSFYLYANYMAAVLSILAIAFIVILIFILVRLNISKARSEEESLETASFLARMSHEIRTPMNSILGMAELIQRKAVSSEIKEYIEIINHAGNNLLSIINDILDFSKIESHRLQIQNGNYHIASVINDMINMMRPRMAEKSLDFFVNIDGTVYSQLYGDDMRLRQILTNLLSNAVKYTRKGFISLDMKMERINHNSLKLICTVEDSGIGIKSEDKELVFTEFTRMDTKKNRSIEGTGLGLAITRALCNSLGGDVTFTSEYGKGSTFQVSIIQKFVDEKLVAVVNDSDKKNVLFYDWRPMHIQALEKIFQNLGVHYDSSPSLQDFCRSLENGSYEYAFISSKYAMDCIHIVSNQVSSLQLVIMVEPGEVAVYREVISVLMPVHSITMANILNDVSDVLLSNTKPKIPFIAPSANILIVDDISTNLRVAKELMAPYNMNVSTCLSGAEALELIKKTNYDIVFMDHMMPGMDGIEATEIIRRMESENGYYQKLPIVALTANVLSDQREMFLAKGISDFLAKPIDLKKLNEILERYLNEDKREKPPLPQTETSTDDSELFTIPGVNVALGLRNSGSTKAVYFNILADFCKDAESRLVQISEALSKKDLSLYVTLVHAVKGAARSIGAMETGESASWLEKAGAAGDIAAIMYKTADFQDDLRALINNIKAAITRNDAENSQKQIDISSLRLETLKNALLEMDIEAVNRILLQYANLSLDAGTKNTISEVEQHILMFEYEKAIEKINELF